MNLNPARTWAVALLVVATLSDLNTAQSANCASTPGWPVGIWNQTNTKGGQPCTDCVTQINVTSPTSGTAAGETTYSFSPAIQPGLMIVISCSQPGDYTCQETVQFSADGCTYSGTWFDSVGQSGTVSGTYASQSPQTGAMVALSPPALDFGPVGLSDTRTLRFSIKNVGAAGSVLTGSVQAPLMPFSITSGGGAFSIPSGQTQDVTVAFQSFIRDLLTKA